MNALLATASQFLFQLFLRYKYWLLFPITALEGPLITMAAGFLVSTHQINPWIALPIIIAGDTTGDVLYYGIGWFGERTRFSRWVIKKFNFERHKERVKAEFEKRGGKLLLFGKFTHAFGAVFLIGAGYAQMDLLSFVWYSFIGTAIKSSILMYVGYLAGSAYATYASKFESGSVWVAGITIAVIILGLFAQNYFVSKQDKNVL
jgi:membrane-associated protein